MKKVYYDTYNDELVLATIYKDGSVTITFGAEAQLLGYCTSLDYMETLGLIFVGDY